nr:MAG TPA: hypothetical protein [Caudoviricetes sp.]
MIIFSLTQLHKLDVSTRSFVKLHLSLHHCSLSVMPVKTLYPIGVYKTSFRHKKKRQPSVTVNLKYTPQMCTAISILLYRIYARKLLEIY